MDQDLKYTLNLPQTEFPMRADAVVREPKRLERWQTEGLYQKLQEKNKAGEAFILHDGPPFTSGEIHVGTALNKTLKDIVLRYKTMRGYRTPYVPGWDCHGLPIEYRVMVAMKKEEAQGPQAIRSACAAFSEKYIQLQRTQFERLGVLGEWEGAYRTMDPQYEGDILRTFAAFVEADLIYRSKKPVYWSIPCRTALAETEIEYRDTSSPSIYVAFPMQQDAFVVVWTTTPWTLVSNLAIALHPKAAYEWVHYQQKRYLVAHERVEAFVAACGWEGTHTSLAGLGALLEGDKALHPFLDRESPLVLADYITMDAGTGCVHTAPGHGPDDYQTGLRYGLEVYCPIDEQGCYLDDGKVPQAWVGASVLDTKTGANTLVINTLREKGCLLQQATLQHSYPHCWRSKTPLIFRATDQWFIGLGRYALRQKLLDAVKTVAWLPEWGAARMEGFLKSRPDWCISRQRLWGVPLPVFYDEHGAPYADAGVIRALAEKIAQKGSNFWFEANAQTLLEGIPLPPSWQGKLLTPGTDTLDVWMDSGSSHHAVLKRNKALAWPADLCFEGSDQHRGWFQSLLWTSVVTQGAAPYKKVITHGFIVAEDGKKISKSEGPSQTAASYITRYGADVLRLWIASEDYRDDIPLSENILNQVVGAYRSFRNTLRFQLGNLHDFDYERHAVKTFSPIDQWVLKKTDELIERVTESYELYQFHRAYQELNAFCVNTLSARYHDILKDRLYTLAPNDTLRRSSQTAMYRVLRTCMRLLAPILVFTTDEAFEFLTQSQKKAYESIHLQAWPQTKPSLYDTDVCAQLDSLIAFRSQVHEALEAARQSKRIGQSLDAQVTLAIGPDVLQETLGKCLVRHVDLLEELFIVSKVHLVLVPELGLAVQVDHASGVRCPRSWRWVEALVEAPGFGAVCKRCEAVLRS